MASRATEKQQVDPMSDTQATLGALVNYYNDYDMLRQQWASGQFDKYQQICIFDGPYVYTKALSLSDQDTAHPLRETELGRTILADPRVTYHYEVWEDEAVKRIRAYEAMTTDIVVLHDTDEFYDFDEDALASFITGDKPVAAFYCQNLCLDGVHFASQFYAVDHITGLPHKNFAFHRKAIGAKEHLDYLWLVGVEQNAPDHSRIAQPPLAVGYHFTAMRSREGQLQKYTFYGALFGKSHRSESDPTVETLRMLVEKGRLSSKEALTIYLRVHSDYLGVPSPDHRHTFKRRIRASDYLEGILTELAKEINLRHTGPVQFLDGYTACFYAQAGMPMLSLKVPGAKIHARIHEYGFDREPTYPFEVASGASDTLALTPPTAPEIHGRLFKVEVRNGDPENPLITGELIES